MNELVVQLILVGYLLVLIWFSVSKAVEDGFFTTACTLVALLTAFTVADREWRVMVRFLRDEIGVHQVASISAGFWIGFLMVVLPAMVLTRILARERTPFPSPVERFGSIAAGVVAGLVLFVTTIQSVYLFDTVSNAIGGPLQPFHPIFNALGSTWVPR